MGTLLNHTARVVSELQERLGNSVDEMEDESDRLASLLTDASASLHDLLVAAARANEEDEHAIDALKQIEASKKGRRQRLEARVAKRRSDMAWAMQESSLPKIVCEEFTISSRIGREPLVTTIEPQDAPSEYVRTKVSFSFDNDAIRAALDSGASLDWAHYGNAQPILTVRTK